MPPLMLCYALGVSDLYETGNIRHRNGKKFLVGIGDGGFLSVAPIGMRYPTHSHTNDESRRQAIQRTFNIHI